MLPRADLNALAERVRAGQMTVEEIEANEDLDELQKEFLLQLTVRQPPPSELAQICARSGLTREQLRTASPDQLAELLGPEDLNYVLQRRPPLPVPPAPKPSREEIASEVLKRHAAGERPRAIAKAMGIGPVLASWIIETQA